MAIKTEVKGDLLIITVDVGKAALAAAKPSGSGKSLVIASTSGNVRISHPVLDSLTMGLNVYTPNK